MYSFFSPPYSFAPEKEKFLICDFIFFVHYDFFCTFFMAFVLLHIFFLNCFEFEDEFSQRGGQCHEPM